MKDRRETPGRGRTSKARRVSVLRKRRERAKTGHDAIPAVPELREQVRVLTHERDEAVARESATAEILSSISDSMGDTRPVFEAILRNVLRLLGTRYCGVFLVRDSMIQCVGIEGEGEPDFGRMEKHYPVPLDDGLLLGKAIITGRTLQLVPVVGNPEAPPVTERLARHFGYNALICVPFIRQGTAFGAISTAHRDAIPFSKEQIALIKSFADHAVIAIENTRLLNELRQRTDDLSESLQQQTATADVLKIINHSRFDLQAVLGTLTESAAQFCDAQMAALARQGDAGCYYYATTYGVDVESRDYLHNAAIKAGRGTVIGRALLEGTIVQVADVLVDPEYAWAEAQEKTGFRTALAVPLLREGNPIGVLTLARSTVRPFSAKQLDLVTTFADQAVIAIENVRLFDEIREKGRQLAEASEHKSRFLANMSHELRTPLNAILGYNQLMLNDIYGEISDRMRAVLTRVQHSGRHLLGLINDVLDISKIEAGQLTLSLADYSIRNVVQSVSAAVEPLVREKQLGFKSEVPADLPPGRGDERRLTQVLLNLVSNAIKFTEVGQITINASAADGAFIFSVRDTGPGIDPADQERIFEEFQQADSSITKKKGGTGLGLAIARRVIEMHGGRIWIESRIGNGATFFFTVPVRVEKQAGPT
jgi:signal transduction histidine kinase